MTNKSRQAHLALLFSEHGGAMGLYAQAFIDYIRQSDAFDTAITRAVTEPFPSGKRPSKENLDMHDLFSSLESLRHAQSDPAHIQRAKQVKKHNGYYTRSIGRSDNAFLQHFLREALLEALEDFFKAESKNPLARFRIYEPTSDGKDLKKLSKVAFPRAAKEMYQTEPKNIFIRSPYIILHEAVETAKEVMNWACMWSETPQDVLMQMHAMLEPTVLDPRTNRLISPIEMLGYGNNGYIGSAINGDYPTHLNGRRIIRQASADNPSIINPKFVALWFDRDLHIGGCPAQVHRSRIGDVYMDFARMYIECAEKLVAHIQDLEAAQYMIADAKNDPDP